MTENEMRIWLSKRLSADFEIEYEVMGRHLIENVLVFADMVITPRKHLIDSGFDNGFITIETKNPTNDSGRLGQVLWQAATYAQSTFPPKGRPLFSMVYPSIETFAATLARFNDDPSVVNIVTTQMKHMGQFMNVGYFEWPKSGGWNIKIGGQRYYSTVDGKGNTNLLKRYVGTMK